MGGKAAAVQGEAATASGLQEINADNFYSFIKEANEAGKLVVVDFYTDWCADFSVMCTCLGAQASCLESGHWLLCRCGPCKLMLPLLEQLAVELAGKAEIVKFNCNKHNKELGQSLGIKVAPTFHLYRDEKQVGVWGAACANGAGLWCMLHDTYRCAAQVAMLTGAKIDELKELINKNL